MAEDRLDHQPWPMRAALLLLLGIVLGLVFRWLLGDSFDPRADSGRAAAATFVAVAGVTFAFTLERLRWQWSPVFAVACGLVAGGLVYWNGGPDGWRFGALLLAVAIAAPLFQVTRDEGRWHPAQQPLHVHAWTNVVLWFAAWLFVLIVYLLVMLLAELFKLIGIELLWDLLRDGWFGWILAGGALGAAIGLLRDRDRVLGLLQRVVTVVLSTLTPVLAVGLGLFLLSLPFTGLRPLWEQTSATTPILLSSAIIAVIFANATIGNAQEEEPQNRILRVGAIVLGLVILPLAIIAAVSTALRIGQHGLTPDRLWAVTFIGVAIVYGLGYLIAIAHGRARWPTRIRQTNVWLAVGLCGLALLLATPILDFGAFSARSQVARLEAGKVSVEEFDWQALAFDFGPSGRKALERLRRGGSSAGIRQEAAKALAAESRYAVASAVERKERSETAARLRVVPAGTLLAPDLRNAVLDQGACSGIAACTVHHEEGADWAVVVGLPLCLRVDPAEAADNPAPPTARLDRPIAGRCDARVTALYRGRNGWDSEPPRGEVQSDAANARIRDAWNSGGVEIRSVTRRQVFIGGEPVGGTFE